MEYIEVLTTDSSARRLEIREHTFRDGSLVIVSADDGRDYIYLRLSPEDVSRLRTLLAGPEFKS